MFYRDDEEHDANHAIEPFEICNGRKTRNNCIVKTSSRTDTQRQIGCTLDRALHAQIVTTNDGDNGSYLVVLLQQTFVLLDLRFGFVHLSLERGDLIVQTHDLKRLVLGVVVALARLGRQSSGGRLCVLFT